MFDGHLGFEELFQSRGELWSILQSKSRHLIPWLPSPVVHALRLDKEFKSCTQGAHELREWKHKIQCMVPFGSSRVSMLLARSRRRHLLMATTVQLGLGLILGRAVASEFTTPPRLNWPSNSVATCIVWPSVSCRRKSRTSSDAQNLVND